jgi:hypothetical protein
MGQGGASNKRRSNQIRGKDARPSVPGLISYQTKSGNTGCMNEKIESAQVLNRLLNQGAARTGIV